MSRQQLDALTLKHLAAEFQDVLGPAKVSKVQHPSAHEFLLTFWGGTPRPADANLLYIHLNPEMPFCALVPSRIRQDTVWHQFEKPTALCMLLRKHLHGATVLGIQTLPGERVLNLVFENFNELGNRVRLVLSLELMGKHTNMILYDDLQEHILAVAHGVSERMSSHRELSAGLPYAPPPPPTGKRLLCTMTTQDFRSLWAQKSVDEPADVFLNRHVTGWGRLMLVDMLEQLPDVSDAVAIYQRMWALEQEGAIQPAVWLGEPSRFSLCAPDEPDALWQPQSSVNALVRHAFVSELRALRRARRQDQLSARVLQLDKRLLRREAELVPVSDADIDALQATGDRLLAAMSARELPPAGSIKTGRVMLTHYHDGSPWEIEIDPAADWVENAQVYYRRAKKAKARRDAHHHLVGQLQAERAHLDELHGLIRQADTLAELDVLASELAELAGGGALVAKMPSGGKPSRKQGADVAGVMRLDGPQGVEILVGKSAQGNAAIVGKLARPDDWWLHVHQMPGSHVLVRGDGNLISDELLQVGASLAVWYSSARFSLNVPVVYTKSRYVRKVPQSYPGHVTYRNEQTVYMTPSPEVLEPLLGALLNA